MTLCPTEVNIHAIYKHVCSMHAKVIGKASSDMTFEVFFSKPIFKGPLN
jgi:hypothetical protein